MFNARQSSLAALLERTLSVEGVAFYRRHWGASRTFEELPTVSRDELITTPLSERRYKDETSLVKIVHDGERAFLSEWSFDDIAAESWGAGSEQRPMVYISDPYEAIEKSMWCYEHNILPLLPGLDPDIAAYAAGVYRIDSLITDAAALVRLEPYLRSRTEQLETMTIIGPSFDLTALVPYAAFAKKTRLVLALPEIGAIAQSELSDPRHLGPLPDVVVEKIDGAVAVTKLRLLVTPIIRYTLPEATAAHLMGT